MNEIWKNIPSYEGIYQVSSLGRVKSLKFGKEKILICRINMRGYNQFILSKNNKTKTFTAHQLVAIAFLNHKPDGTQKLVVDHINDNKIDNRLENLQIITQRVNAYKTQGKYSSKYKGVSWYEPRKKWCSRIHINGKAIYLGYHNCELKAHYVYMQELKKNTIKKGTTKYSPLIILVS